MADGRLAARLECATPVQRPWRRGDGNFASGRCMTTIRNDGPAGDERRKGCPDGKDDQSLNPEAELDPVRAQLVVQPDLEFLVARLEWEVRERQARGDTLCALEKRLLTARPADRLPGPLP